MFCVGILLLIGACSAGGGTPVTPNTGPDLSNYASSVEGDVYKDGGPVTSGEVFVYDLATLELFYKADIGADGGFLAGINEGQYLMFAFSQAGWQQPQLEADFSNYINAEAGIEYRIDLKLNRDLPSGDELMFGFVTSADNNNPIGGARVSAGGRTTLTDGYGFYAMTVPSGTANFTVSAEGFFDLNRNIREGQANGDFYDSPFFELNPINQIGGSIGGIIRDIYDGAPLGGVRVTLAWPANPDFLPITFLTNLGGEYRFYNLPEAIYKLYVERPGYVSGTRDGLVIKDQDDVIINQFMHRDNEGRATVWGYVKSASISLPVSGARVTATNPLLGSHLATTGPVGKYEFMYVIPGNYTMTVTTPGTGVTYYEAASTFQTVVPGDNQVDFALRFIDEGVLRGTVTISGGGGGGFAFPPAGIEITAEKVGGSLSGVKFRTTTNGVGIFVLNGLPMGIYKVEGMIEYQTTEVYSGTMLGVNVSSGQTTNIDLELILN